MHRRSITRQARESTGKFLGQTPIVRLTWPEPVPGPISTAYRCAEKYRARAERSNDLYERGLLQTMADLAMGRVYGGLL
jgi:hypothetical protein